jgi:medium-chain acyl-[acyl-carrier-protein] hydrolase
MNGTPDEVLQNEEILSLFLPTLRADFAICEEYMYTPDAPLECPIFAYGGQSDPEVREEELRAWREQAGEEFTLQLFPGNHFFLHTAHRQLLRAIAGELSGLTNLSLGAHPAAGAGLWVANS